MEPGAALFLFLDAGRLENRNRNTAWLDARSFAFRDRAEGLPSALFRTREVRFGTIASAAEDEDGRRGSGCGGF